MNRNAGSLHRRKVTGNEIPQLKGCLLAKPRSPVPKLKDLLQSSNTVVKKTDFIRENICFAKNLECKKRPNISQDSCDGHCQDLEKAGLLLKYVHKKEYGKIPSYICRYRRQQQESRQKCKKPESPRIRHIDEDEKQAVLNGLKNNFNEAQKQLLLLPVITDTLSKQKRKIELENRLTKLEKDIEMLEKNDIFIIKD